LKYVSTCSKTKKVYKNKNNQKTIAKNATNCAVTKKNVCNNSYIQYKI